MLQQILKQLRRQYRPLAVQPPYCLSGRCDEQSLTQPLQSQSQSQSLQSSESQQSRSKQPSSLVEEKVAEPGLGQGPGQVLGLTESVGSKRKATSDNSSSGIIGLVNASQTATSNTTTASASTTSNNDANIDSARGRYLARQQQQQQQQQHGTKR